MKIEALLSDVDGTLLNTHGLIVAAFDIVLSNHHISHTIAGIEATIGKSLMESYRILTSRADVADFMKEHGDFQEANLQLATLFPGVSDTLKKLKTMGIKIAAVSTRTRNCRLMLDNAGIFNYFDAIVTGDDVINHKPDPEALFLAMEELSIKPQQAIMMGDIAVDIKAGRNAGTRTVGVTYGSLGKNIKDCNPDYIIDFIEDILPIFR
jgi:pyrophosphatase PpaX